MTNFRSRDLQIKRFQFFLFSQKRHLEAEISSDAYRQRYIVLVMSLPSVLLNLKLAILILIP